MSRAHTMITITEDDKLKFYRICRKMLRKAIKDGKILKLPAADVFSLTDKLVDHYLDYIQSDIEDGRWNDEIVALLTKGDAA